MIIHFRIHCNFIIVKISKIKEKIIARIQLFHSTKFHAHENDWKMTSQDLTLIQEE